MITKISKPAMGISVSLLIIFSAGALASAQDSTPKPGITRAPQAIIDQYADRGWLKANLLDLVSHWTAASVSPNGFVNLNMDRQWKPWGTQREASVESQGRQVYAMAIAYENSNDQRYLDGMKKAADFLLKMHDDQYGGFYLRVTPDLKVLDDTKSGLQAFALLGFANAYRVSKDPKYLDAAMELFHVLTGKMKEGEFSGGSMKRDFSGPAVSPYARDQHHVDVPDYGPEPALAAVSGVRHSMSNDTFEACLDLYEATHSKEVWAEITAELATMSKMYDNKLGYMPSVVDENWKAVPYPGFDELPAGINEGARLFQWASIFSRAVEMGADPKFAEMGSRAIDLGLKVAFNHNIGGMGGVDAHGRTVNTFWWSQCEALKALGRYAVLHGRSDLWPYYEQQLAFIKNNYVDYEYGGWYDEMVPGWSRATLAEHSHRAYNKGALDANEFEAFHQASMFKNLLNVTQPR